MRKSLIVISILMLAPTVAWSAPKFTPITLYKEKPAALGAPGVKEFTAGDNIYAVATFPGPLANYVRGDVLPVSLEVKGAAWGGLAVRISPEQRNDTSVGFWVIHGSLPEQTTRTMFAWFDGLGRQKLRLEVVAGAPATAVGPFDLDLTAGTAAYDAMKAESKQTTAAANANVPFPEAGMRDAKLEKQARAVLEANNPKMTYKKIIIRDTEWYVSRHPVSGLPVERRVRVAALSQNARKDCFIEVGFTMRQKNLGGNKWGKLFQGGGEAGATSTLIPCQRLAKLE